jgi:hypothetical protein
MMSKVLVIGESCTDIFIYGTSERKSPEGKGPVFIPKYEILPPLRILKRLYELPVCAPISTDSIAEFVLKYTER